MTHLEKILAYCALAPNIEKYCARKKTFKEKHPTVAEAAPVFPMLALSAITVSLLVWGDWNPLVLLGWLMIGLVGQLGGLCVWNALTRRTTRKKVGYSWGIWERSETSEEETQQILEKLLRLPATPQTQELKNQLWELASRNLLPLQWWKDVEKEIDAWVASHEREVLRAKLLETGSVETMTAAEVETETETETPSPSQSSTPSAHRVVL